MSASLATRWANFHLKRSVITDRRLSLTLITDGRLSLTLITDGRLSLTRCTADGATFRLFVAVAVTDDLATYAVERSITLAFLSAVVCMKHHNLVSTAARYARHQQ